MNETVSIIIPVYNNERTILRCLLSVVNQDWQEKEIIIIDDESTDNSYKICKQFSELYPDVVLLSQKHAGQSAGRNFGIQGSRGSYICFCDADDELLPSALSSMMNLFHEPIDMVVGNVKKENSPVISKVVSISQKQALRRFFRHDNKRLLGSVYGKIFRSSIISSCGGKVLRFDESIKVGEDALFLFEYLLGCRNIILSTHYVYSHERNPEGIIASSRMSDYLTALDVSKKMIQTITIQNQYLLRPAVIDAFHTFILILKRTSSLSDAEVIKEAFCSLLMSLRINLTFVNLPLLKINSNNLVVEKTKYHIRKCYQKERSFIIDGSNYGILIMPSMANMHIHFEDFCDTICVYQNTDEFLTHKQINPDVAENIKKNLLECKQEGAMLVAYTHKDHVNDDIVFILHQSKEDDAIGKDYGWMLCNILAYQPQQVFAIFACSKRLRKPVFFHLSSTIKSDTLERKAFEGSFISCLAERGLLSEMCYIIHGSYLTERELYLISKNHANIIICPVAEYKGNENTLEISLLDQLNITWMLGSDSQALAGTSSILYNAMFLYNRQSNISINELLYHISTLPIEASEKWAKPIKQQYIIVDLCGIKAMHIKAEDIIHRKVKPLCCVNLLR